MTLDNAANVIIPNRHDNVAKHDVCIRCVVSKYFLAAATYFTQRQCSSLTIFHTLYAQYKRVAKYYSNVIVSSKIKFIGKTARNLANGDT